MDVLLQAPTTLAYQMYHATCQLDAMEYIVRRLTSELPTSPSSCRTGYNLASICSDEYL